MKRTAANTLSISACSFELQSASADGWRLLFPLGDIKPKDGRTINATLSAWRMDVSDAENVVAKLRARSVDVPIDYEHQILQVEANGQPAPAAGWVKDWRVTAQGLEVFTDFTAKARAHIDAKEYRYWSPVFHFDPKTGRVLQLLHIGLTNTPALDLPPVSERAAARALITNKGITMDWEQYLRDMLGLSADASAEDVKTALLRLKGKSDDAAGEVAAARAAQPDPTKHVPIAVVAALQTEVAALRASVVGGEVASLIESAIAGGKIAPVMKDWATALGTKDAAALRAFINIAPATQLPTQDAPAKGGVPSQRMTPEALAVCAAMGLPESVIASFKGDK